MASKFRTGMTSREGSDSAKTLQCRVLNVNVANWTVDVLSQYDRKNYFDIQVSSPYMHHSNGEGISVLPEVGATCMVTLPSDSSPPFVLCFVMAHEVTDVAAPETSDSTTANTTTSGAGGGASFAGGRGRAIPGSIYMKTRDGNFVTLHRGGVVQVGSTELAQTIYIPLGNLIMDMSENYEHHNSGGSMKWGIQDGPTDDRLPSQYLHTFRVFSSDRYADIKIAGGKVFQPMPEPDGGVAEGLAELGKGTDNPIIFEVAVSPKGFVAESGENATPATVKQSVMKFAFDRKGNQLLRAEGNVVFQLNKKLTIRTKSDVTLQTDTAAYVTAKDGITISGGSHVDVDGGIVTLNKGTLPVARVGDVVTVPVILPVPVIITFAIIPLPGVPTPGLLVCPPGLGFAGSIASGNGTVLA